MEQSTGEVVSAKTVEGVESKAGVKRALSLSPRSSGESCDPGAESAGTTSGQGPEIKRRNVAIYSENTEIETQEEA